MIDILHEIINHLPIHEKEKADLHAKLDQPQENSEVPADA